MAHLAAAAEARIRLDEFVAAHHAAAHGGSGAAGDPVLHAFVCCVECCLVAQTRELQALAHEAMSRSQPAHSWGLPLNHSSLDSAAASAAPTPLTLLELNMRTVQLRAQLQLLAAVCHCAPDAQASACIAEQLGCIMPPSRWRTQGFPGGAHLLTRLHAGDGA